MQEGLSCAFALLLLLGAIHVAAKTNLASMMADRQSQSTGDEAVSAALARKTESFAVEEESDCQEAQASGKAR